MGRRNRLAKRGRGRSGVGATARSDCSQERGLVQGDAVFTAIDRAENLMKERKTAVAKPPGNDLFTPGMTQAQLKNEVQDFLASTGRAFEFRDYKDPFWSYPAVPYGTMMIPLGMSREELKKAMDSCLGDWDGQGPGAWCVISQADVKTIMDHPGPTWLPIDK